MPIDNVRDAFGPDNANYVRALERKLRDYEERLAKLERNSTYVIQRSS